jgi:hypothetical protein
MNQIIFLNLKFCSNDVKMIFWYLSWFQILEDQCGSVPSIPVAVLDLGEYIIRKKIRTRNEVVLEEKLTTHLFTFFFSFASIGN